MTAFGVHPESTSPLARKIEAKYKELTHPASMPVPPPPPIKSAIQQDLETLNCAAQQQCGSAAERLMGRQIILFLLAEKHGEKEAAKALRTITMSVTVAYQKIAPLVASLALEVDTSAESFTRIFTAYSNDVGAKRYTRKELIALCAKAFEVSVDDMMSARRTLAVIRPRQVAMFLCKRFTPSSFPEIGKVFGGRDHTTILHACRKIEHLVSESGIVLSDDPRVCAATLASMWRP